MPFGLQPIHLIFIVIVALLIFGPRRLPEIGRGVGKAINEFRRGASEMTDGLREEITKPIHDGQPESAMAQSPSMAPPAHPQDVGMAAASVATAPVMAPAARSNFCSQCGSANAAEAHFCQKCGSQLSA